MNCENCKRKINKKDNYFKVDTFENGILIESKFVHKNCQDKYDRNIKKIIKTQEDLQKLAVIGLKLGKGMVKELQGEKE